MDAIGKMTRAERFRVATLRPEKSRRDRSLHFQSVSVEELAYLEEAIDREREAAVWLLQPPGTLRGVKPRDKYFCSLSASGLKPAAILDTWNSLPDDERRRMCPNGWQKLEGARETERRKISHIVARGARSIVLNTPLTQPEESKPIQIAPNTRARRVAKRNALFVRWHKVEGLSPAAILDKWNKMSDDERRTECPDGWQKLDDAGPKRAVKRRYISHLLSGKKPKISKKN